MTAVRTVSCLWIGIKPSGDIVNGKYIVIPEIEEKLYIASKSLKSLLQFGQISLAFFDYNIKTQIGKVIYNNKPNCWPCEFYE